MKHYKINIILLDNDTAIQHVEDRCINLYSQIFEYEGFSIPIAVKALNANLVNYADAYSYQRQLQEANKQIDHLKNIIKGTENEKE